MLLRPNEFLVLLCIFLRSNALPQFQGALAKGTVEAAPLSAPEENVDEEGGQENEPSCAELKAMWRFSKRQSRAPEITNEIPTYRDPFAINVWDDYARPRSAGRVGFPYPRRQLVYGKLVHILPKISEHSPERIKAFQDVFANREYNNQANIQHHRKNNFHRHGGGGGVKPLQPQSQGSFQHLKELIRNERARELQEQRMSDEAERSGGKDSGKYPYGRLNESPPSADNVIIRSKPVGGSRRMAGYPEMLMSARYFDEYPYPNQHVAMNKYKPQYADTSLNRWSQLAFPPLNKGLAYGRQGSPRKPRPRHHLTWQ